MRRIADAGRFVDEECTEEGMAGVCAKGDGDEDRKLLGDEAGRSPLKGVNSLVETLDGWSDLSLILIGEVKTINDSIDPQRIGISQSSALVKTNTKSRGEA